jgi:hypothetical protein
MLIGLGAFVLAVMVASMVWTAVRDAVSPTIRIGPWLDWATSITINLLLNLLAVTTVFHVMPKARVPWHDALRGGRGLSSSQATPPVNSPIRAIATVSARRGRRISGMGGPDMAPQPSHSFGMLRVPRSTPRSH